MQRVLIVLLALAPTSAAFAAESPQQAFARQWEGRAVTVRWPLYTLVYNERGKLGTSRQGLREGIVVATLSQGAYLQFDGRQGRDEVRGSDPVQFLAAVNSEYEADALDVRAYRKLEALTISRFDPGAQLRVSAVRVDRDQVQFVFATPADGEVVTGIRIQWAGPLSKSFTEREAVEGLVQQFVQVDRP